MARPIWKGSISFGLVNIPVSLFSAEKPSEGLHFHLLDKKTHSRIHNQRVNEQGQEVAWDEIDHAYEFQKGKYVIVNPKMLEKAAATNYETIQIEKFVPFTQIDPIYFSKPYYLIPNESGSKGYMLLQDILTRTKKAAIAYVVIKTREHLAAIIPQGEFLTLIILRFAKELHSLQEFAKEAPLKKHTGKLKPKEITLAEQLVTSMSGKWQPEKYKDNSKELLKKLINADIKKGKSVSERAKPKPKTDKKVVDFAELLAKSVKTKRKKS